MKTTKLIIFMYMIISAVQSFCYDAKKNNTEIKTQDMNLLQAIQKIFIEPNEKMLKEQKLGGIDMHTILQDPNNIKLSKSIIFTLLATMKCSESLYKFLIKKKILSLPLSICYAFLAKEVSGPGWKYLEEKI